MELSELKNIFDAGGLKSAIVIPAALEDGYCIIVTDTKRANHVMTAQRSNGQPTLSKLTGSIVSLEAGFDRGYLKKARKAHLPILAKIEACCARANKGGVSSNGKSIKRFEDKVVLLEKELAMVSSQRDRVLTQNLQLWVRLRELELAECQSKPRQVRLHH